MRISAPDNTNYYGPKTDRIDTVYGRKYPVFTTFTVRFRIVNDAVLIDLGSEEVLEKVSLHLFWQWYFYISDLIYRSMNWC